MNLIVRAALGSPRRLQKSIGLAISGVNKDQALSDVRTLEQIKAADVLDDRLETMLLTVFAVVVALLLAAIGIYGVISYSVAQRTHELGIRAPLQARARGIFLRLVLVNGLMLASAWVGDWFRRGARAYSLAFQFAVWGVGARDPLTMVSVAGILGVVALVACLIPALRATQVDPLVALRHE